MWGWLQAIVQGIVAPLIAAWQQKLAGRQVQQRDDLQATLETERTITETLARDDDVRAARERAVRDIVRGHLEPKAAPDARPKT